MYPADWHSQVPSSKKKRAREDASQKTPPRHIVMVNVVPKLEMEIPSLIMRKINTSQKAPATPPELNLDVVLTRLPYKNILENLFGREEHCGRSVPLVLRSYEELYMRESLPGERNCAAGDMCECKSIDATKPFVGTEFILRNHEPGPEPEFCVLCSRKVTQKLFYDIVFTGAQCHGLIQRYGNVCNVEGEYARECMLICPRNGPVHCMPDPIMSHQRNRYEVYISNGVKHIRQVNVYFEDYANPVKESSTFPCIKKIGGQPQSSGPPKLGPSAAPLPLKKVSVPVGVSTAPTRSQADRPASSLDRHKAVPSDAAPPPAKKPRVDPSPVVKLEPPSDPPPVKAELNRNCALPKTSVIKKESTPSEIKKACTPAVVKKESTPSEIKKTCAPVMVKKESMPVTVKKESTPVMVKKESTPCTKHKADVSEKLRAAEIVKKEAKSVDPISAIRKTTFIPGHAKLNDRIAGLHCRLQRDEGAQALIDAHLPAAAVQMSMTTKRINKLDASYFVLVIQDAPQFRNLPDVGWLIRERMSSHVPISMPYMSDIIAQVCLPCQRLHHHTPQVRNDPIDAASCWVLLNLLLASLLGLYPKNDKKPPFRLRVWLYSRVHAMLTSPRVDQSRFVTAHESLFQMAVCEYVCNFVPHFLPVEHEKLTSTFPPMQALFAHGNVIFDTFRLEAIDSGTEPWHVYNRHAQVVTERLSRLYRAKCRSITPPSYLLPPKRGASFGLPRCKKVPDAAFTKDVMDSIMGAHAIVRYPFHDHIQNAIQTEYKILTESDSACDDIHKIVQVSMLGARIRSGQEDLIRKYEQHSELLAKIHRTLHLCLLCERTGCKKNTRICSRTGDVVCQEHGDSGIVAIDTLGKVVRVRGVQYIFTVCCGTVQVYSGDGSDFVAPPFDRQKLVFKKCKHQLAAEYHTKSAAPRPLCCYCESLALQQRHNVVDITSATLTTLHLCQKHTPPSGWLYQAINSRQFDMMVYAWATRRHVHSRRARTR